MLNRLRRVLIKWHRNQEGLAALEFAIVAPVLLVLFYGGVEVTRYILIVQKTEKLAHAVSDMITQSKTATYATMNQVMSAASDIMNPYSLSTNGTVIVSSLYRAQGVASAKVNWRYQGGGSLTAASKLGSVNGNVTMPTTFTFDERENVIAAEVYYRFSPLLTTMFFDTTTVYRVAFYKPRLGELVTPPV